MARQWTSRQTPGRRCRLAAISIRKIAGTTVAVGMANEIAVIASSEKPNPAKPRTIAAAKTQAMA